MDAYYCPVSLTNEEHAPSFPFGSGATALVTQKLFPRHPTFLISNIYLSLNFHQQKVYDEIVRVLGYDDKDVEMEDLADLKYLEQCIKETLRIFTLFPITLRKTTEEITLNGKVSNLAYHRSSFHKLSSTFRFKLYTTQSAIGPIIQYSIVFLLISPPHTHTHNTIHTHWKRTHYFHPKTFWQFTINFLTWQRAPSA